MNGQCIGPICDNCHVVNETLWECHHWDSDPNGYPCSTVECIQNVLSTASCDYKGDNWPCKKVRCNTNYVLPFQGNVMQTIHSSPCPGGIVDWVIVWDQFYMDLDCSSCIPQPPGHKACEVGGCANNPIPGRGGPRGFKLECGSCP